MGVENIVDFRKSFSRGVLLEGVVVLGRKGKDMINVRVFVCTRVCVFCVFVYLFVHSAV